MKGRPPKPNAVKLASGSRHARAADAEPRAKTGVPKCPSHLDGVARKHWAKVTALMLEMGTITLAEGDVLELYCTSYSIWRQALKSVAEDGAVVKSPNGCPVQNPFLAIMNKAHDQLSGLAARLGFTPADRARVHKEAPAARKPAPLKPGDAGGGPPKMRLAQ